MTKLYRAIILILIGLFSVSATAGDYGKGHMTPLDYEKLAQPISLNGSCKQIRIIEWRPTPGYNNSTKLTSKSAQVVNDTCNLVVENFYRFMDSKKSYRVSRGTKFDTSLSFLPADLSRQGKLPRNLNDIKYRFAYRSDLNPLWGYFQRDTDWAYIRNDVLNDDKTVNKGFVLVTAHELFHAMSYASGVFHQHKPESYRDSIEEEMAQQFTEFVGLGR